MTSHAHSADQAPLSAVAIEVLLTLAEGEQHGYAIKRPLETRLGDGYVQGSGSLYQALQRLERRGLIAEVPGAAGGDARRGRVYTLRPEGRRTLATELGRMRRVLAHAKRQRIAIGPEGS
jgi:DNA-binding PadR family transcriptional regulator